MINVALIITGLVLTIFVLYIYRRQWQNAIRPAKRHAFFSGSPGYIAGSTNGSPLSDLGSHCGFKAVGERRAAASSAIYATVASFGSGRIYDFSVCLHLENRVILFLKPEKRVIKFSPFCIEEQSYDRGFTLKSRIYFLQKNLAVLETTWESNREIKAKPVFYLMPTLGRDLENPYPHFNGFSFFKNVGSGLMLKNYHRMPGLKLYTYFISYGQVKRKKKEIEGNWINMKAGQKITWPVVIAFSPGSPGEIKTRAERALQYFPSLQRSALTRWSRFQAHLPVPCKTDDPSAAQLMKLSASALWNNLYYPRLKMLNWGSVPAKVYFPFIWGWDTPQHIIGLSEFAVKKAKAVMLTQLQANYFAPKRSRFKLKVKGISIISSIQRNQIPSKLNDSLRGVLNLYSQPPLQSWAAVRIYEYLTCREERQQFLREALPLLKNNIQWWEENRKLHNDLFSFVNGLESGLDDSPRFYPPSFLPSFVIGLVPRFFAAVDLNCWLYQSYANTAYLSEQLGDNDKAYQLRQKADRLRKRINNELWSKEMGCWLDKRNGSFIKVITPTVWWPILTGVADELPKIKAVITDYLLNKERFWGDYGIPSVAFSDRSYNSRKEGYYWRGQIWMINNYSALEVLYRYGYFAEADELHRRILQTLANSQGLYETYNAKTGAVGWSSRGPGDPAVMQFGMSSAWTMQILLCRYQHFCYILPETKKLHGHIRWATTADVIPAVVPPGLLTSPVEAKMKVRVEGISSHLPCLSLESADGLPILKSSLLDLFFDVSSIPLLEGKKIEFTWHDQDYHLQAGVNYRLNKDKRGKWVIIVKQQ